MVICFLVVKFARKLKKHHKEQIDFVWNLSYIYYVAYLVYFCLFFHLSRLDIFNPVRKLLIFSKYKIVVLFYFTH